MTGIEGKGAISENFRSLTLTVWESQGGEGLGVKGIFFESRRSKTLGATPGLSKTKSKTRWGAHMIEDMIVTI